MAGTERALEPAAERPRPRPRSGSRAGRSPRPPARTARSTPASAATARSARSSRGYASRSPCSWNCAGLTNRLAITVSHSARAAAKQRDVARVQRAHRRDEADDALARVARAPRRSCGRRSRPRRLRQRQVQRARARAPRRGSPRSGVDGRPVAARDRAGQLEAVLDRARHQRHERLRRRAGALEQRGRRRGAASRGSSTRSRRPRGRGRAPSRRARTAAGRAVSASAKPAARASSLSARDRSPGAVELLRAARRVNVCSGWRPKRRTCGSSAASGVAPLTWATHGPGSTSLRALRDRAVGDAEQHELGVVARLDPPLREPGADRRADPAGADDLDAVEHCGGSSSVADTGHRQCSARGKEAGPHPASFRPSSPGRRGTTCRHVAGSGKRPATVRQMSVNANGRQTPGKGATEARIPASSFRLQVLRSERWISASSGRSRSARTAASSPLGGAKQRALLALLLLRANELVPTERLVDELWGERPPRDGGQDGPGVRLAAAQGARPASCVETRGPGYVLRRRRAARSTCSASRTRSPRAGACSARRGAPRRRATRSRGARALARRRARRLPRTSRSRRTRSRGSRSCGSSRSSCGSRPTSRSAAHAEAVPELEALVREHPLRESLRRLLMLALYRSRPPGRGARGLPGRARGARRRARPRAEPGAAAAREGDPASRTRRSTCPRAPTPAPAAPRRRCAAGCPRRQPCAACPSSRPRRGRRSPSSSATSSRRPSSASGSTRSRCAACIGRFFDAGRGGRSSGTAAPSRSSSATRCWPSSASRSCARTTRCARCRAALELRRRRRRSGCPQLQVRIGVNTGEVVAGDAGGRPRLRHRATRSTSASGSRRPPAPGEILLGAETYALVAHAVEGELLEPVALKGKREPHVPFRLASVDADAPAFLRRDDAPLVGRGAELARLRGALRRRRRGRGRAARHARRRRRHRQVAARARAARRRSARPATVLIGRCPPYGEGVTFLPLRELLRHAGGRSASSARRATRSSPRRARSSRSSRASAPVVAVFEDVHWAEPTFLDLVEYLAGPARRRARAARLPGAPRAGRAAARRGCRSRRSRSRSSRSRRPSREQLLDELGAPGRSAAADRRRSRGQPALRRAAGGDRGRRRTPLPASIRGVLAERLDRLGREERAVLERGAVAGRSFSVDAVHRALPAGAASDEVHPRLLALVRARLLRPDPVAARRLPLPARADPRRRLRRHPEGAARRAARADGRRSSADDALVGFHLEQAVPLPRAARPDAEYALAAAGGRLLAPRRPRRAARRGDVAGRASRCSSSAVALLPDDDRVRSAAR